METGVCTSKQVHVGSSVIGHLLRTSKNLGCLQGEEGKMVTLSKMESQPCVEAASVMANNKGSSTGSVTKNFVNLLNVRDPSEFVRQFLADNPLFLSSAVDDYIRPLYQNGDIVLDVECGLNQGWLYLSRLCQGSRGPCILYQDSWLTPNEFQLVSGRETAKDWKRSIRHCGKSMKLLLTKGILSTHPLTCECDSCRLSSMNRSGRGGSVTSYGSQTTPGGVASSESGRREEEEAEDRDDEDGTETDCYNSPSSSPPLTHAVPGSDADLPSAYSRIMEALRSAPSSESELNDCDRKRENRLTSIIDQLLSNRIPKVQDPGENHLRNLVEFRAETGETRTAASSPLESCLTGSHTDREPAAFAATLPASKSTSNATRRKKQKIQVKTERCSPEITTESSRSDSPHSPASLQSLQRTPSYPGTPPTLSFTPPAPSYSPHHHHHTSKTMESHLSRNYSDFMRSLAAKYNNNNATANEFLTAAAASRGAGFLAGIDPRFQQAFKPGSVPFLGLNPLHPLAALANHHQQQQSASQNTPTKKEHEPSSSSSSPGTKNKDSLASSLTTVPPQPATLMMAGSFPMIDMSSTQALLHMVRSASAQQSANQQLETYLRGAIKRPTDSPLNNSTSASLASPLDLSGSACTPPQSKKIHLDTSAEQIKASKENYDLNTAPIKRRSRTPTPMTSGGSCPKHLCLSSCAGDCSPESKTVESWTVDQVVHFVASIDLCAEYAEVFQEHCIDGAALSLLTENHLTKNMNLKLGPALKFQSVLAKKLGHCAVCLHCVHCHGQHSSSSHHDTASHSFSSPGKTEMKKGNPEEIRRPSSIN